MQRSADLVETALELGIRHFDVAPSYGLGTAEEVLGLVLGSVRDVTITTKVGIPRPPYSRGRAAARRVLKPLLGHSRPLKSLVTTFRSGRSAERKLQPIRLTPHGIRSSLEESLRLLRRDSVDVLLLHEPSRLDLNDEIEHCLGELVNEKLISQYGVGIDAAGDRWRRFGSVWQSRWPQDGIDSYEGDLTYVFHGAIRHASAAEEGGSTVDAATAVSDVLRRAPRSVVLVSSSSTKHLRELMAVQ